MDALWVKIGDSTEICKGRELKLDEVLLGRLVDKLLNEKMKQFLL